jgi:hypothetical protein
MTFLEHVENTKGCNDPDFECKETCEGFLAHARLEYLEKEIKTLTLISDVRKYSEEMDEIEAWLRKNDDCTCD